MKITEWNINKLDEIYDVYSSIMEDKALSKDEFSKKAARKDFYGLLVETDDKPVSIIGALNFQNRFTIYELVTDKQYRHLGYASLLLEEIIKYAGELKVRQLAIIVPTQAKAGLELLKSNGFMDFGHLPNYYHNDDGIKMIKIL